MHTCVMTLAYLRGKFFACSSFCLCFLRVVAMFYKNFDATMQKFLVSVCQGTANTFLLECLVVPLTPSLGAALLRLSATLSLGL